MITRSVITYICVIIYLQCISVMAQESLNIIIIKAHPDEAEEYAGGTAALLVEAGHNVKFLSLTNGDVGHWKMSKKEIAKRRAGEAVESAKRLGVTYEILDHHDGEYEFAPYQRGILNEVPSRMEDKIAFLHKYWGEFSDISTEMRNWLVNWFGKEKGETFRYGEEFEIAPFSRKPSKEELLNLFPVLSIE